MSIVFLYLFQCIHKDSHLAISHLDRFISYLEALPKGFLILFHCYLAGRYADTISALW